MTTKPDASSSPCATGPLKRRGVLLGAAAAGAAAVAVKVVGGAPAAEVAAAAPAKPAETAAGYRLTAHVQRYYETTRT